MKIKPSVLIPVFLVLPVLGSALLACGPSSPAPAKRTPASATPTPAPAKPTPAISRAAVLFEAPEAVIALAADGEENLYALTVGGTLLKVTPDGESQELAAGLQNCNLSFPVLAALSNGTLVTNECVDDKDTLVRIDQSGSKVTWLQLEQSVESIAADAAGTLYLGTWSSVGNLTLNFQPTTYLAGAEQLNGQVLSLGQDGQLTTLYEGGIPLAVAVDGKGQIYAALWGRGGAFSAESKSYSMCGSAKHFWIILSEQVQLQQVAPEQKPMDSGLVAVSYLGAGPDYLLAFGMPAGGDCGIYQVTAGQGPQRVVFEEEHITDNLTAMLVTERSLYFGDADGNVYQVGLDELAVASAAAAPAEPAAPPSSMAEVRPTDTPTPATAVLTTREGRQVALSNLTISDGRADPEQYQQALWVNGVFVRFDYIQRIEFGDLPGGCCTDSTAEYTTTVTITLIDNSVRKSIAALWFSRVAEGDSDLGHFETELWKVESFAFQRPAAPAPLPNSPPPSVNEDAVSAIVTDREGTATAISDLTFHFYVLNRAWSPPIITDVTYRYLPISSGFDIDLGKVQSIEFLGDPYPAEDWDIVTITLTDGNTITDRLTFNPRSLFGDENHLMDVEGDAALGRLDLYLREVKNIVLRR